MKLIHAMILMKGKKKFEGHFSNFEIEVRIQAVGGLRHQRGETETAVNL